jgi:antitoxin VapB
MMMQTAKIVSTDNNQVVYLPEEFYFKTSEVYISKQGESLIISPKKTTWDTFFNTESAFDEDFLKDREDNLPQEREF